MTLPTLVNLDHVEVSVEPWSWPFATARRADIDAHLADLRRRQTALWNGRALMLHSYAVDNGMLTATAFEADYASYAHGETGDSPIPQCSTFSRRPRSEQSMKRTCSVKWPLTPPA